MTRIHRARMLKSTLIVLSVAVLPIESARAEMVLYDKDGWTLKHDGLAQGFYSATMGDSVVKGGSMAPAAVQGWGGWDNPGADASGNFYNSRFRSGWTGSRFNWVASHVVSPDTTISAVLGIAFAISTDDSPTATDANWDVRNAFIKIENRRWGELYVGRHVGLYTLGSIISTINSTSAALGYGHGCSTSGDGLGCYTSGYGVRFPGFWSGIQYQTPDLSGLRIKVAALDPETAGVDVPNISVQYRRRPLPMFQSLIRYEGVFGPIKLIPYFNGFTQTVGLDHSDPIPPPAGASDTLTTWGVGGGVEVHVAGLRAGAGGSYDDGTSFYGPLYTKVTVVDGNAKLRKGNSYFIHALYAFSSVDVAAGFSQANIERSANDEMRNLNLQKSQGNIYASVQYHWDKNLTFLGELNALSHKWSAGNSQDVQVVNFGASFSY